MLVTPPQARWSWLYWTSRCAVAGGAAGLVLSVMYALPFIGLMAIGILSTALNTPSGTDSVAATVAINLAFVSIALVVALVVGVLPATVLGAVTAFAIGWAMWGLRPKLKWWSAALLGLLISAVPALLLTGLALLNTDQSQVSPLLVVLLVGLPAAIYVVAEAVVAAYLYTRLRRYAQPSAGAA